MATNGTAYLYVFDTMADWEVGYLTAELNSGRFFRKECQPVHVVTVAAQNQPVVTMGGLTMMPDITLTECRPAQNDLLILPGGNTWETDIHAQVIALARQCLATGVLTAAICGATVGLARAGLLNDRKHTSSDLNYLKAVCPAYTGAAHFLFEPAVTDGNLITAWGISPLAFTVQILRLLDVMKPDTLEIWYQLNLMNNPDDFYRLMNSLQA